MKVTLKPINKNSRIPLYYQIFEIIKKSIENNEYQFKTQLPTELELSKFFNVSRMTIRQALLELSREGLIEKIVGKGTFVKEPKVELEVKKVMSYSRDMLNRGLKPSGLELSKKVINEPIICERMGLPLNCQLLELVRLRKANDIPMAIETAFINLQLCPGLEQYDFNNVSLYQIVIEKFNLNLGHTRHIVQVKELDKENAKLLETRTGMSCFYFQRLTKTISDISFEWVESLYRGDRYYFILEMNP